MIRTMPEYVIRRHGHTYSFSTDVEHLTANAGSRSDAYMTYEPENYRALCKRLREGKSVSLCSDWAVDPVSPVSSPDQVYLGMRDYHRVSPGAGGFRLATPLDAVHMGQAVRILDYWKTGNGVFGKSFLNKSFCSSHPLYPYAAFAGLDIPFVLMIVSLLVDSRRFVMPENPDDGSRLGAFAGLLPGPCDEDIAGHIAGSDKLSSVPELVYYALTCSWGGFDVNGGLQLSVDDPSDHFLRQYVDSLAKDGGAGISAQRRAITAVNCSVLLYVTAHMKLLEGEPGSRFNAHKFFRSDRSATSYCKLFSGV